MSKYLILGKGYLGNRFREFLPDSELSGERIRKLDAVNQLKEIIERYNPQFVINCIGKTGRPNIDWCETHKEETFDSNVLVARAIAEACQQLGKKMVHLSSGCIYEGDNSGKGFTEEDKPNFTASYYSQTKAMIEGILIDYDVLQLRIRMPLDSRPNGRNLIDKLVKYNQIVSTPNSITVIPDFLEIAQQLMEKGATGIYNIVCRNPITHEQLLAIYDKIIGVSSDREFITPEELDKLTKARRSNCVLSTKKLEALGVKVRDVKEAAEDCMTKYIANSN